MIPKLWVKVYFSGKEYSFLNIIRYIFYKTILGICEIKNINNFRMWLYLDAKAVITTSQFPKSGYSGIGVSNVSGINWQQWYAYDKTSDWIFGNRGELGNSSSEGLLWTCKNYQSCDLNITGCLIKAVRDRWIYKW